MLEFLYLCKDNVWRECNTHAITHMLSFGNKFKLEYKVNPNFKVGV